jgi:ketosteroid isomerase-like protein
MTYDEVTAWLDRYIAAWASYDPAAIGDLFTTDAAYRYHPSDPPIPGREAIVAAWTEPSGDASGRDDPSSWTAHYEPYAVDGDRAVAIGESRYTHPDGSLRALYFNLWTLRFDDDGRCVDYVEYFMELPERLKASR